MTPGQQQGDKTATMAHTFKIKTPSFVQNVSNTVSKWFQEFPKYAPDWRKQIIALTPFESLANAWDTSGNAQGIPRESLGNSKGTPRKSLGNHKGIPKNEWNLGKCKVDLCRIYGEFKRIFQREVRAREGGEGVSELH